MSGPYWFTISVFFIILQQISAQTVPQEGMWMYKWVLVQFQQYMVYNKYVFERYMYNVVSNMWNFYVNDVLTTECVPDPIELF